MYLLQHWGRKYENENKDAVSAFKHDDLQVLVYRIAMKYKETRFFNDNEWKWNFIFGTVGYLLLIYISCLFLTVQIINKAFDSISLILHLKTGTLDQSWPIQKPST